MFHCLCKWLTTFILIISLIFFYLNNYSCFRGMVIPPSPFTLPSLRTSHWNVMHRSTSLYSAIVELIYKAKKDICWTLFGFFFIITYWIYFWNCFVFRLNSNGQRVLKRRSCSRFLKSNEYSTISNENKSSAQQRELRSRQFIFILSFKLSSQHKRYNWFKRKFNSCFKCFPKNWSTRMYFQLEKLLEMSKNFKYIFVH